MPQEEDIMRDINFHIFLQCCFAIQVALSKEEHGLVATYKIEDMCNVVAL